MTVHEVEKLSGVSARTLHYYDEIGLLHPAQVTEAGYRRYDEESLKRLEQILLFRELEFPLKAIKEIINAPDYDREVALTEQIELLKLKRDRLNGLIDLAQKLKKGENKMDFTAFDKKYEEEAKKRWGQTDAYREYAEKAARKTEQQQADAARGLMNIFAEFGKMKQGSPADDCAQAQVKKLQDYITQHFYTCTKPILLGLSKMYRAGGEMTGNIDRAGGDGTAEFAANAIEIFCK